MLFFHFGTALRGEIIKVEVLPRTVKQNDKNISKPRVIKRPSTLGLTLAMPNASAFSFTRIAPRLTLWVRWMSLPN